MMTSPIQLDRLGFPMVLVPEADLYVQALPVTKIQFERFLCDVLDAHFDQKWYSTILRLSPRISPQRVWAGNYWQAFLTGVLPMEAERFARWMGPGYRLPTEAEWSAIFHAASAVVGEVGALGAWSIPSTRGRELLQRVGASLLSAAERLEYPSDLATSMGLRLGVLEWATASRDDGLRFVGLGEPHPAFCGNLWDPEESQTVCPADLESERSPIFGFRLVRELAVDQEEGPFEPGGAL
jgi:Sulfatase-modifying factor enzyme 1